MTIHIKVNKTIHIIDNVFTIYNSTLSMKY